MGKEEDYAEEADKYEEEAMRDYKQSLIAFFIAGCFIVGIIVFMLLSGFWILPDLIPQSLTLLKPPSSQYP